VSTASERVDALSEGIVGTLNRHLDVLVLALAVLIIFGSPLTYMIVRGFEPHQSLSGRLSQFRIRDVLAMVHAQGRTGVLRVYADSTKGRVYFKAGEICHCVCGGLEGKEALEKVITGAVDGHFVFSRPPRAMPTTIETPLSMILLDLSEKEAKKTSKGPEASPTLPQKKKSKMKTLLESKT
jgi:hypothetical protein